MSYYDILLAKQLSGGGGGGDITVESLSVTANGTYSAPSGKAYSPVVANVPNSYTASDEGKVVSSGALVAQTSQTIDTNGTYDTTLKNSVTVNVSGGGGASNVVTGTLYATTAGVVDITLPYTGSGYPMLVVIYPKGGIEKNTDFADLIEQGAYQYYGRIKTDMDTAPSSVVSTQQYTILTRYKTNSTSATRYTVGGGSTSALAYKTDGTPIASDTALMYFRSANSLSVYLGGTTTSGHLALGIEYEYKIVYSS